MQLMIDTSNETPRALRAYAVIMDTLARLAENQLTDAASPQQAFRYDGEFKGPWNEPSNVVPFVPPPPPLVTTHGNAPSVAPAAAAVANPTTAASGCDSTGLPWDERIHSSGENKLNADGTWRQKRGANPMLVASVTAELRARQQAPTPPPAVPVRPLQVGDILTPVSLPLPVPPPPVAAPVHVDVPGSVVPLPAAPPVGTVPAAVTFTQLFAAANRHGFDNDRLTALVAKAGGTGLESLVNNPALIAIVYQMVQETVNAQ